VVGIVTGSSHLRGVGEDSDGLHAAYPKQATDTSLALRHPKQDTVSVIITNKALFYY